MPVLRRYLWRGLRYCVPRTVALATRARRGSAGTYAAGRRRSIDLGPLQRWRAPLYPRRSGNPDHRDGPKVRLRGLGLGSSRPLADYVAAFGTDRELDLGGFFGWLSNDLPGFCEGRFVKVDVILQGGSARPLFFAHDDEMPLARDQREGISFDALLDLYARCGRDSRPHLEPL